MQLVKLPNGNIVPVDDHDFITVKVMVDLSKFIDNDLEGVLDELSELATGSTFLSDMAYKVIGVQGGSTLEVEVTGSLDMIMDDVEEIEESGLPMIEFEVEITRTSYGNRTIRLSARTAAEAEDIADDDAGNHLYPEHTSEYTIRAQAV